MYELKTTQNNGFFSDFFKKMYDVYDEKGKMISVQYENIQNVNKNYSIAFKKPVTSGQIVKVFVWNSLNSLMPMSLVETISVK